MAIDADVGQDHGLLAVFRTILREEALPIGEHGLAVRRGEDRGLDLGGGFFLAAQFHHLLHLCLNLSDELLHGQLALFNKTELVFPLTRQAGFREER